MINNTDFPEDLFQPAEQIKYEYNYILNSGAKIANNKTAIICGICRDVESVLELNIKRLHRIGNIFSNYEIFIYENDSTDSTVDILNKHKSDKFSFLSETKNIEYKDNLYNGSDKWHYNRCKILANCRNKYLEYANNLKYDYLIVVDIDILGGWSYDGLKHSVYLLNSSDDNACVSSYGILSHTENKLSLEQVPSKKWLMYDSFAFEPLDGKTPHMLERTLFNKIQFNRGDNPILVNSNFGGLSIYKKELLNGKFYDARSSIRGFTEPDHTILHEQIRSNGFNILLNPSMIVSYSKHKYCT